MFGLHAGNSSLDALLNEEICIMVLKLLVENQPVAIAIIARQ